VRKRLLGREKPENACPKVAGVFDEENSGMWGWRE
jgi:hypothetical protein